jgi:hypothetical protein
MRKITINTNLRKQREKNVCSKIWMSEKKKRKKKGAKVSNNMGRKKKGKQ